MSKDAADGTSSRRSHFARSERLSKAESIALLVFVVGLTTFDAVSAFTSEDADPLFIALGIATNLSFALYLWAPVIATAVLGLITVTSFMITGAAASLVPAAIAAALVTRLGATWLILAYVGGFVIAIALLAAGFGNEGEATSIAPLLVAAALSGVVGIALRLAYARGHRLESELAERARLEREAILAERRWIAGELHDSIAHHLTVVAMHSQLLDDDVARPQSQDAIRTAARKALSDLRFVIQLAEDAPSGTEVPSGDLASAIDEAREEFEATGLSVACEGDPADENIPRGAEIILARIVRESATNILKYAGAGDVRFRVDVAPDSIALRIRSPLPDTPRRDMPSTGTGLNRMAERVLGVSGEFSAGPEDDSWLVAVRLPIAA